MIARPNPFGPDIRYLTEMLQEAGIHVDLFVATDGQETILRVRDANHPDGDAPRYIEFRFNKDRKLRRIEATDRPFRPGRERLMNETPDPVDREIEVTPEMIEAGAAVLDELCPHLHDYPPYIVERVYRAMEKLRGQNSPDKDD